MTSRSRNGTMETYFLKEHAFVLIQQQYLMHPCMHPFDFIKKIVYGLIDCWDMTVVARLG